MVGYSLGGNVALKFVGEAGRAGGVRRTGSAGVAGEAAEELVEAAAAVSVPFDLARAPVPSRAGPWGGACIRGTS